MWILNNFTLCNFLYQPQEDYNKYQNLETNINKIIMNNNDAK